MGKLEMREIIGVQSEGMVRMYATVIPLTRLQEQQGLADLHITFGHLAFAGQRRYLRPLTENSRQFKFRDEDGFYWRVISLENFGVEVIDPGKILRSNDEEE